MATFHPPLNQVALSVVDLRRTERWFREGLGFLPAGGSRFMASGFIAARVQGMPGAASTMWWMVGREPGFQLELFQFRRPMAKLMPPDRRPNDTGYTRIGVAVDDFDATLKRLAMLGSHPFGPTVGDRGERRVCVRSPDGVHVELMEDDPLRGSGAGSTAPAPVALRSVTLSTPNLEGSIAFFRQLYGYGPVDLALHTADHEALWGLPGARCERAVFKTGTVLLEVVQYLDPPGKPWPAGYRICDQGILNIAFGADNRRDFTSVYERALAAGAVANCKPLHLLIPRAGVVYVNDPLGFSVELVWMKPGRDKRAWGWEPLSITNRPNPDNQSVSHGVRLKAPIDAVWAILNDQDQMSKWIGFKSVHVIRAGFADRNGVGSERSMKGPGGEFVEQIVALEPQQSIRYRVLSGSPFQDHQGEIRVQPMGAETDVTWTIRFRSRIPLMGRLLRAALSRMLAQMLASGLKPHAERSPPGGNPKASTAHG